MTYTLTAKNTGNITLTNVTVTDAPALTGFSCTPASPVASLAPNATVVCTGTHAITQADLDAGTFVDTASATSTEATAPNAPDTITATQTATLTLTKTDNLNPTQYTTVGQVVSYTLTATNTGNVSLHNVTVTDAPALTGFSCTPASPVASLAPAGTVVCTGTHTITYSDLIAGSFTDTGTADSDETAPVTAPDTITATPIALRMVGDYVWFDTNHDGVQNVEEAGVAGVTVKLYASSDLSTPLAIVATDGSGAYLFDTVIDGSYVIEFVAPPGYQFTTANAGLGALADSFDSDAAPGTGLTGVITVSGASNVTVDAGLVLTSGDDPARIGDRVWYDTNNDGDQDPGEPGIAGVTVELYAADGTTLLATTVTDGSGFYEFAGLAAGTYVVEFAPPAGYSISPQDLGGDDTKDSDPDQGDGSVSVTLAAGQQTADVDAGMYIPATNPASIGDRVWYDSDGDGIQDRRRTGDPRRVGPAVCRGKSKRRAGQYRHQLGGRVRLHRAPGRQLHRRIHRPYRVHDQSAGSDGGRERQRCESDHGPHLNAGPGGRADE